MKKNTNRIVLFESGSVLDEGIKNLLAHEPGLDFSAVSYSDRNIFLASLDTDPDAVLLNEVTRSDSMRTSEFLRELSPEKNVRVIVVQLEDNVLEVYEKRYLKLINNTDLIDLLQNR